MAARSARRRAVATVTLAATTGALVLALGAGDRSSAGGTEAVGAAEIAFSFGGGLYAMRPDGSGRVRLTPRPANRFGLQGDEDPAWSPDGTLLAFQRTPEPSPADGLGSQIYLLSPGDGRLRPLTAPSKASAYDPAWSPDGRRIAFVRSSGDESALVVLDVEGGGERVLQSERQERGTLGEPAWSPDGARIAYTRTVLDRRHHFHPLLYLVDVAGGVPRLLARDAGDAAWSPDGRRIAFASVRDRNGEQCYDTCFYKGELYVMDADGTGLVRLTRNRGDDGAPSWSPDGRRIAFASDRNYPEGMSPEIYSIRPDGSCLTWLSNGSPESTDPAWRDAVGVPSDSGRCGAARRPPRVEIDLGRVRGFAGHPVYWLGKRYGNLLLDSAEVASDHVAFTYGDCASFRPRSCPEPIQLQVSSVCSRRTTLTAIDDGYGSLRVFAARGLLFIDLRQGDLSAITGRTDVRIFPDSAPIRRSLAATRRLRPLGAREARLPPPALPRALLRRVRRAERAERRLGSVVAAARALGIRQSRVRNHLKLGRAVRSLPSVRAIACRR
jgi:TolB protein